MNARLPAPAIPLGAALATLLVAVALLFRLALRTTGGTLVYALDDAYIHMAVARHLVEHGSWGVTPGAFAGVTSSLLWPPLLAAAGLAGVPKAAAPMALNLLGAAGCVVLAARMMAGRAAWPTALFLAGFVLAVPLPTLVLSGMEHVLHVAAVLWLLTALRAALHGGSRGWIALGMAALLCAALRYESVFLLAPAAVVLGLRRRWRDALALAAGGAIPVLAYAMAALRHGWPPLPMPLILKGAMPLEDAASLLDLVGGRAARALLATPELLVSTVTLCAAGALVRDRAVERALAAIVAVAVLLHAQMAGTGWLYRYEAYLVAAAIVVAGTILLPTAGSPFRWPSDGAARAFTVAGATLFALPLAARAGGALRDAPGAVRDIHRQQYQMGLFTARHYPGATVMANDIGAITFLADVNIVDLYGLATRETAEARRAGALDRGYLERLTARLSPDFIVVYRSWFGSTIPASWIEVGSWRAPPVVVAADRTVTFYAPDPARAARLRAALDEFAGALPADVDAR